MLLDQANGVLFSAIAAPFNIEFERIGCDRDHIHLLCSAHPKVAPGQIVRIFKSITVKVSSGLLTTMSRHGKYFSASRA